MTNKRALINVFLVVFIDLLGFGLILPLLPFYAENYGASDFLVGVLIASYSAAELVGAPLPMPPFFKCDFTQGASRR